MNSLNFDNASVQRVNRVAVRIWARCSKTIRRSRFVGQKTMRSASASKFAAPAMRAILTLGAVLVLLVLVRAAETSVVSTILTDRIEAQSAGICGRSATVQRMILNLIADVDACAEVTDANLASITFLSNYIDGAWRGVYELKADDFAGLINLGTLYLIDAELRELPEGVFDELVSLRVINLLSNRITELPDGLFSNNVALTTINISRNRLTEVPKGVFDANTSLTTVDLHGNSLTALPDGIFENTTAISSLDLADNELESLPSGVFDSMATLEYLNIEGNRFSSLPDDIFDSLTQLTQLYLSRNSLTALPANFVASPPSSLTELDLGDNELRSLPEGFLSLLNQNGITRLNLSGFELTDAQIALLASRRFANLAVLNLADTGLTVDKLITLLEGFHDAMNPSQGVRLQTLDISRNGLGAWFSTALADEIQRLRDAVANGLPIVTDFYLNDSTMNVAALKPILESLPVNVLIIDLSNCDLSGIADDIGMLSRFVQLNRLELNNTGIDASDLTAIVENISTSSYFNLYLRDNELESLPADGFKSLTNLYVLALERNNLRSLPAGFIDGIRAGETDAPQVLLSDNELSEIPGDAFGDNAHVSILDLDGNRLNSIGADSFDGLASLVKLYLSDNEICEIEPLAFESNHALEHLELANNCLSELDDTFYEALDDTLVFLDLSGNKFVESVKRDDLHSRLSKLITALPPDHAPAEPISIARILRIEPAISNVILSPGDPVKLSVNIYGRQNLLDDELANGRTITWDDGQNGTIAGSGAEVEYSAPQAPGSYTVTATVDDADCFGDEDQCSATFKITVRRSSAVVEPTPALVNPAGTIPTILTDPDGNQYEVFTPEGGGTFTGDTSSLKAGPGAVPNGEIVGLRIAEGGSASNEGKTYQRYNLGGNWYEISAVDAANTSVSSYGLNNAVEICIPLPDALRSNISDLAIVAINSDDSLTILSSSVRISSSGTNVCGSLSSVPAKVAAGTTGSPAPLPTEVPDAEDASGLPETGGSVPSNNGMLWALILGLAIVVSGYAVLRAARRRNDQMR